MLITDKESLSHLKELNKLALTATEDEDTLAFFAERNAELSAMNTIATEDVAPMVHVMPTSAVLREDEVANCFTRDELHSAAPKVHDGYLCVPRLLE